MSCKCDPATGIFNHPAPGVCEGDRIKIGAIYKINPRYAHRKTLVIKALDIIMDWVSAESGIRYVCVWGRRVRPANPNVTFGADHAFTEPFDQFEEVSA